MKKGRTTFTYIIKKNMSLAERIISKYLEILDFKYMEKKNKSYYIATDIYEGMESIRDKYFDYEIVGDTLTIQAWVIRDFAEYKVERSYYSVVKEYARSLNDLTYALERISRLDERMLNEASMLADFEAHMVDDRQKVLKAKKREWVVLYELYYWAYLFLLVYLFVLADEFDTYYLYLLIGGPFMIISGLKTHRKKRSIFALVFTIVIAVWYMIKVLVL